MKSVFCQERRFGFTVPELLVSMAAMAALVIAIVVLEVKASSPDGMYIPATAPLPQAVGPRPQRGHHDYRVPPGTHVRPLSHQAVEGTNAQPKVVKELEGPDGLQKRPAERTRYWDSEADTG